MRTGIRPTSHRRRLRWRSSWPGRPSQSQFGRALRELGVELIPAHSPQAKGRVERLFKTFQDRLVKELRLARIATLEAANRFLESYVPIYNRRFAVCPAQAADLHRPSLHARELTAILCLKATRCLRNDFTIAHQGQLYQIRDTVRATHVQVEERMDGTLHITYSGPTTRLSRHCGSAPEAAGRRAARARTPAFGETTVGSPMAETTVAGQRPGRGHGHSINRTFLL